MKYGQKLVEKSERNAEIASQCLLGGPKQLFFCKFVNFSPWLYLSGEKKFVLIGHLLFEIRANNKQKTQ